MPIQAEFPKQQELEGWESAYTPSSDDSPPTGISRRKLCISLGNVYVDLAEAELKEGRTAFFDPIWRYRRLATELLETAVAGLGEE